MKTMIPLQKAWTRVLGFVSMLLIAGALGACSGEGAGAGGSAASPTGASNAASLSLITDETSLGTDGKKTATITAIVKSSDNVALKSQPITFSTTDAGSTLQVQSSITDVSGSATAQLSIADRSVRNITVIARSGQIENALVIPVAGTVLQISGSNTIVFDSPTQFSLSLRDSGGNPVAGAPVTLTSVAGNLIEPASVTTDAQGQASFSVTGTRSGNDSIQAMAQGVSSTFPAAVSAKQLTFEMPQAGSSDLLVNVDQTVQVRLVESGIPQAGQNISFASTRGSFQGPVSVQTDASGLASTTIRSSSSGFGTLTATASGGTTVNRSIEFVSRVPESIKLQTSPTVVGANIDVNGTNASQLIAKVRDLNDNPVKGVRVNFSADADPSNGKIEPSFALTDSLGVATASFVAGSNPTGSDGVVVRARINDAPTITATAPVTVSELELSVRIGTGQKLEEQGTTIYKMPWTAIVADSAQNPVPNALVTVSLNSLRFRKAAWRYPEDGDSWIMVDPNADFSAPLAPPIICDSEDINLNRRLDAGEDRDGDSELDPGAPATVSVISPNSRTDADGLANIQITYPKSYGAFVEVELVVSITTVEGTESSATKQFWLPLLANDVRDSSIAPPGVNLQGPFGERQDCADPR